MSSLADRLRGVVGRQSAVGSRQSSPEPSAQDLSCLRGEWRDGCFVVERRCEPSAVFGRDEVCVIGRRLAEASAEAALVARNDAVRPPFVFFDLETTGLAGGAGTCAFLVGCARFHEDGSFVVRQFLLVRQAEEPHLLALAARELGTGAIVSFNGKSFDVPLLELRHQFHRRPWAARGLPHLDLLYPARRVWRGEEHSLVSLERRLLGARRDGDVPGFEIPSRYFQFVRTGDARPLVPVLEHNRLDLLSLAALTARLLGLVRSGPSAAVDAQEALALGRIYEGAASGDRARESFERAICLGSPFDPSAAIEGLRALARLERRERRYGAAAGAWRRLLEIPGCPPHVRREASEALAIHHEHRVGDLGAARTFALRSLSFSAGDRRRTASGRHRLARLDRKMAAGGTGFVDRDGLQFKR